MYRKFALVLLLMLGHGFANAAGQFAFTRDGPLQVSEHQMTLLFQQCSRRAPKPDKVLSRPTQGAVKTLESKLKRFLGVLRLSGKKTPPATLVYERQYVAYSKKSRRKIYGNFIPAELVQQVEFQPGEAVVVCDGGQAFWGIVYDVQTQTFEQLEFNGF